MLRFLVLASFAALALAKLAPWPRYLEDLNKYKSLVGGEEASADSWPWKVSIQVQIEGTWEHNLTGVLIKRGWVLTSGISPDSKLKIRVVLGEHDIYKHEGREQYISVSDFYTHPDFHNSYFNPEYDIALLRLSSDASLNNYVQLGVLPPSGQVLPNNYPCYYTAWVFNDLEGQNFPTPSQAYLPVFDLNTCSSWWGSPLKTSMVCAGGSDIVCQGISFGLLNCSVDGQWVVHGVTSFVSDCNTHRTLFVYTRVSSYISWINSIIG